MERDLLDLPVLTSGPYSGSRSTPGQHLAIAEVTAPELSTRVRSLGLRSKPGWILCVSLLATLGTGTILLHKV